MKAVMIIYNLALTEKVEYTLEHFGIRGYTQGPNMKYFGIKKRSWVSLNISDKCLDEVLWLSTSGADKDPVPRLNLLQTHLMKKSRFRSMGSRSR